MPASANTFGTFLNTFSVLEKQKSDNFAPSKPASAGLMLNIVKEIAESGDEKPLKAIVDAFPGRDSEVLATVLEGRNQGIFEVKDSNGQSVAKLTALGRAFVQ